MPIWCDPLELLRLGVLRDKVEGIEEIYKAKHAANQVLVDFQPEIDGTPISRTDLNELMKWEPDAVRRRKAAAAFVGLEKDLHKKVLDLINKRNKAAKSLGFQELPASGFRIERARFG